MHGTSEKHKPVHSNLLVPRNAYVLYQLLLRTDSHQRCKKPTISAVPLVYVRSRRSIDEELRFVEDVLDPFDPGRCVDIFHCTGKPSGQALQTIRVALRVEDGVAILLIQPLALFHNRGDFGSTLAAFSSTFKPSPVGLAATSACASATLRDALETLFARFGCTARKRSHD
jgi:hypothetical protein